MKLERALSIADLAQAARRRLPPSIHGYVSGGSEDHQSLEENRAAFRRWYLRTHALVDVSQRSLAVDLFGTRYRAPIGIAPMGVSGLCHFEGDVALARAAAQCGVPAIMSAASTVKLERVMSEAPGTWYQAYLPANREVIGPLLERLRAAQVHVLVVTIDVPLASTRENEIRNGFTLPLRLTPRLMAGGLSRPRWMLETFARTLWRHGVPHFENFTAQRGASILYSGNADHRHGRTAMNWDVISWIREHWQGRLVLKGILRPDDALRAQQLGCDGVIVSNHGGRQLDGAIAPLDALPGIAAAVSHEFPVMIDSGFRRGTDAIKALALGASYVFVGRPAMYGLAAGGQAGVVRALELLHREIDVDLALLGCPDVAMLNAGHLARQGTLP